jgi:hypothetical protein
MVMQNTKMGKSKKGPNKQIVLMHTNKQKDRQIFWRGMIIAKQRKFLNRKYTNKREKLW